ncbi:MAG: thiamine phosphate synthase [Pseudomonadota bacterium]
MIYGLYAITDHHETDDLLSHTEQVLLGGAQIVQYRDKSTDHDRRYHNATALCALCSRFNVPLIVNDDIQLAATVDAAGVHLGQHDGSLREARNRLGADALIGVSCYASMRRAVQAQEHGASYVAFGAMFPSSIKPFAPSAPLTLLTSARDMLDVTVVAIGGITLDNASNVVEAGANAVAVISALKTNEPAATAAAFRQLFDPLPAE